MSDAEIAATAPQEGIDSDMAAGQGMVAAELLPATRSFNPLPLLLGAVPPLLVFILLIFIWEYGVRWFGIKTNILPPPSLILQTIPTIGELRSDAVYTTLQEALPGFLVGSWLGFLVAVVAARFTFFARGIMPYAVITNSIPIIGSAPIVASVFTTSWQPQVVICAILTFFPMLINAYRGLVSVDPLSLQLMRSYAANGWETFFKLRLPASLPYVFNALKINSTLAMIGAIIGERFGLQSTGLGLFIYNQAGQFAYPQLWAAVVVACAISIAAYLVIVILERFFTSWHISYRSGR